MDSYANENLLAAKGGTISEHDMEIIQKEINKRNKNNE